MTSKPDVPYGLLRHQGEMLRMGGRIAMHTALRRGPRAADADNAPIIRAIHPPAEALVRRYVDWACAWTGAASRYDKELPPHMVSQWSLPLVGELLLRLPYRLTAVINQGASLHMHGPLPRDTLLIVTAKIEQIEPTAGRTRVVVAITTGTEQQPKLVEARLHMSFLQPGPRPPKTTQECPAEPQWRTAGLRFALLTGDFNPIHWCGPLARRSVFGGKVLHGFGSLVRSYEALEPDSFREIDVRFVRPVPLPCSMLSVQVAQDSVGADGWRAIRLAGAGDAVHLAGRMR